MGERGRIVVRPGGRFNVLGVDFHNVGISVHEGSDFTIQGCNFDMNVSDFGAVGDGTTDDTALVQVFVEGRRPSGWRLGS